MTVDVNAGVARIEGQYRQRLRKAAIHVSARCKINCNRPQDYERTKGANGVWYKGLDPSKPGEFPKRVIGDLVRSITNSESPDGLSWRVGTNLIVGLYLEFGTVKMRARPWLRQTLEQERETVMRILSTT